MGFYDFCVRLKNVRKKYWRTLDDFIDDNRLLVKAYKPINPQLAELQYARKMYIYYKLTIKVENEEKKETKQNKQQQRNNKKDSFCTSRAARRSSLLSHNLLLVSLKTSSFNVNFTKINLTK